MNDSGRGLHRAPSFTIVGLGDFDFFIGFCPASPRIYGLGRTNPTVAVDLHELRNDDRVGKVMEVIHSFIHSLTHLSSSPLARPS